MFAGLDELSEFFTAATRLTGITDFSQRTHVYHHPRAGEVGCDLAEYLVGMFSLADKLAELGLPKEAGYVLFREQVDSHRERPHRAGLEHYAQLPAEYIHAFLDTTRYRLAGMLPHVLKDFHEYGIPAEYAGTVPVMLGFIDPAMGIKRPLEGYEPREVIDFHQAGVPAEYARDVISLRAAVPDKYRVWRLYHHGVPAEYAQALMHTPLAHTIRCFDAGIPAEYAAQL